MMKKERQVQRKIKSTVFTWTLLIGSFYVTFEFNLHLRLHST
jgi:hypothetical protein